MASFRQTVAWLGIFLTAIFVGSMGCTAPVGPTDDGDTGRNVNESDADNDNDASDDGDSENDNEGDHDDDDPFEGLCGSRTVTSLPQPGVVRDSGSQEVVIDPTDSPLAAALALNFLKGCEGENDPFEFPSTEYEVGPNGIILSIDGTPTEEGERFIVESGCPAITSDAVEDDNFDEFDPFEDPFGGFFSDFDGCGDDEIPLFKTFFPDDPETDEFICVALDREDYCVDCREEDGAWILEIDINVTFRALGTLEDVETVDFCADVPELIPVTVTEGDQVNVFLNSVVTFEQMEEE